MAIRRLLPRRRWYRSVSFRECLQLTARPRPTIRRRRFARGGVRLRVFPPPITPSNPPLHRRRFEDSGCPPLCLPASARDLSALGRPRQIFGAIRGLWCPFLRKGAAIFGPATRGAMVPVLFVPACLCWIFDLLDIRIFNVRIFDWAVDWAVCVYSILLTLEYLIELFVRDIWIF